MQESSSSSPCFSSPHSSSLECEIAEAAGCCWRGLWEFSLCYLDISFFFFFPHSLPWGGRAEWRICVGQQSPTQENIWGENPYEFQRIILSGRWMILGSEKQFFFYDNNESPCLFFLIFLLLSSYTQTSKVYQVTHLNLEHPTVSWAYTAVQSQNALISIKTES